MQTITAGTWAELRAAYLAGAGLRSLARRAGIAEGTVLAHAHREGWSASKRQALQKAGILADGRQSQSKAIADAVADDHAERAQAHLARMGGLIEVLGQHAETLAPGMLFEQVGKLETFDRMARRNFGLDSGQGRAQITLLTDGAACFSADFPVFEGETWEGYE
jgi:hypothetical protein